MFPERLNVKIFFVDCVEKPTDNPRWSRRLFFDGSPGPGWGLRGKEGRGCANMRGGADECHAESRTI
jgi:hypothetical protein